MKRIGKYELLEELGKGGMGVVYRAYDPQIDREVAIKVILQRELEAPEVKKRFYREARSAGKVSHENITIVHDLGEVDGMPYIVMEYLKGADLKTLIANNTTISLKQKLNYAIQICCGLRAAHAQKIIHRDIKPENVKVLDDGRVKIMDFGIARPESSDITQQGVMIGTPAYMSPEQIKGLPLDNRSDIFSFGVLLYEFLSYTKPFEGSPTAVIYKIINEEPNRIILKESAFVADLQEVVSRCLEKEVKDRYQDCDQIMKDLQSIVDKSDQGQKIEKLLAQGLILCEKQRYDEALSQFNKILQIDPNHSEAHALRQQCLDREKQFETITLLINEKGRKHISHYRIIKQLGEGGMGIVYQAEDTRLKRTVALKVLAPNLTSDAEAKRRFMHEAQAASALDHPNICTVFEINETPEGLFFICMSYCEGITLKQMISDSRIDVSTGLNITIQIALGLAKAHKQGVVHRDVKPANIIIAPDGQVKVVDFGLAKLSDASKITRTGSTMGTPYYMAPEQVRGFKVDHRADIWALGVVLYQILTARLPFTGDSAMAILFSIVNDALPPLHKHAADVPVEFTAVLEKALQKKVEDRYGSMQEFLTGLQKIQRKLIRKMENEISDCVDEGMGLLEKKDYDKALELFKSALNLDQSNQTVINLIGQCESQKEDLEAIGKRLVQGKKLLQKGELEKALTQFEEILTLVPDHPEAKEFAQKVTKQIADDKQIADLFDQAEKAFKSDDFEQAVKLYRQVLKMSPRHPVASARLKKAEEAFRVARQLAQLVQQGKALVERQEFESALAKFTLARKLQRNHPELAELIARCNTKLAEHKKISQLLGKAKGLKEKGKGDRALSVLEQVIAIDANHKEARALATEIQQRAEQAERLNTLLVQAESHLESGDFEQARKHFRAALKIDLHNQRARAGCEQAEAALAKQTEFESLFSHGKECLAQKSYDKALQNFTLAHELDQKNREVRHLMTQCESKLKEIERITNLLTKGKALLDGARYEEALQAFREITTIEPGQAEAKKLTARALEQIEQEEHITGLLAEAAACVKTQKFERAAEIYQQVLEIQPENVTATIALQQTEETIARLKKLAGLLREGRALLAAKKYEQAFAHFSSAQALDQDNQEIRDLMAKCQSTLENQRKITELFSKGKDLFEQADFTGALSRFNEIIVLDPRHAKALQYIPRCQKQMEQAELVAQLLTQGETLTKNKQFVQAIAIFERILEMEPQNRKAAAALEHAQKGQQTQARVSKLVAQGKAFLKKDNYQKALDRFRSAREIEGGDPEIETLVSSCEKKINDLKQISQLLAEARAALENHKTDRARQKLDQIKTLDPKHAEAEHLASELKGRLDRSERVRQLMSEAQRCLKNNELEQALDKLDELLKIDPKHENTLALRAQTKKRIEKVKRCNALLARGKSLLAEYNYETALAKFQMAYELDSGNAELPALISECKRKLKQFQNLDSFFDQARKYYEHNRYQKAEQVLKQILEVAPNDIQANILLKTVQEELEHALLISQLLAKADTELKKYEFDRAAEYFREVLSIDRQNARALSGLKKLNKTQARLSSELGPLAQDGFAPWRGPSTRTKRVSLVILGLLIVATPLYFTLKDGGLKESSSTETEELLSPPESLKEKRKSMVQARVLAERKQAPMLASVDFKAAMQLQDRAEKALDDKQYAEAENLFGSAEAKYQQAVRATAGKFQNRASIAKQKAIDATILAARKRAKATPAFQQGLQAIGKGDRQYKKGNYMEAEAAYSNAEQLFKKSIKEVAQK
ncbi:MAG: protein kinase [bacterium]